jgi:dGTPase
MADWHRQASLEGQIADIADRIAYNCHDLEDGIRSRLLNEDQLGDIELYGQACEKIDLSHIQDYVIRRTRIAKTIMDILVSDAIETSKSKIAAAGVETLQQVLDHPKRLIGVSDSADQSLLQLEAFLLKNMYYHDNLKETAKKIHHWLEALFEHLCGRTDKMPHYYQNMIDVQGRQRTVCDYISGMTDRFCLRLVDEIK